MINPVVCRFPCDPKPPVQTHAEPMPALNISDAPVGLRSRPVAPGQRAQEYHRRRQVHEEPMQFDPSNRARKFAPRPFFIPFCFNFHHSLLVFPSLWTADAWEGGSELEAWSDSPSHLARSAPCLQGCPVGRSVPFGPAGRRCCICRIRTASNSRAAGRPLLLGPGNQWASLTLGALEPGARHETPRSCAQSSTAPAVLKPTRSAGSSSTRSK